jgi:hypothetical protein
MNLLKQEVSPRLVWAIFTLVSIWLGHRIQSGVLLNHDVSWIAHSARWWLRGATFGTDILDPSPPLAWILSLPAAAIAETRFLDEPAAIRLTFWAYFCVSVSLTLMVARFFEKEEAVTVSAWIGAYIIAATLFSGFSFGQREYLSALLAMPYLTCAAARLSINRPMPLFLCLVIGIAAGIGFLIKPFFLAVPAMVELTLVVKRGPRILLRAESVALATTALTCVAASIFLMPDYLSSVLPLIVKTYWAYETHDLRFILARFRGAIEPALFGVAIAAISRTWSHQHAVLASAIAGYAVSYFVQSKGFVYHAYPIVLFSFSLLGVVAAKAACRFISIRPGIGLTTRRTLIAASLLLAFLPVKHIHDDVVRWYASHNVVTGNVGKFRNSVIEVVQLFAPSESTHFFAFSTHPFPGFPTASYTKAKWSGRSASQFLVPAYARRDEIEDLDWRAAISRIAETQRLMVVEDFETRPPSVVFVERTTSRLGLGARPFDDIGFYLEEPRFKKIWARYEEISPLGPLRVFRLKSEGHLN